MMTENDGTADHAVQSKARAWSPADTAQRMRLLATPRRRPAAARQLALLAGLTAQTAEHAQARSYGREAGGAQECLSLLREFPALLDAVLQDEPEVDDEKEPFDRGLALKTGRALAQGIHVALHQAWREGQRREPSTARARGAARLLSEAERTYRRRLLSCRSACRRQLSEPLQALLVAVVDDAFDRLVPLTRHVASLPPKERDAGVLGMRVARLGRRSAHLAAALVLLRGRLHSRRTRTTTAEIARSRTQLCRNEPRLRGTARTLRRASAGDRVRIRGRIRELEWVARPDKPYTRMRLQDTDTEVYAHYKNLERLGIQPDMAIWIAGKVERVSDADAVIAEFEGPGEHAARCWEDWLATEVRPAYDLYPEVLFMEWEYPPARGTRIAADVRARLGRRHREER